jgi:sRNA-binding regulator protein Hfq
VVVEVSGVDQMIFKHAISTIATDRSVANYFSSHHP